MKKRIFGISELTKISILSAISVLLMMVKTPLPFAPTFMELDVSELPALIGGFAMGPIAGVIIVILKIVLNIILNGSKTYYIGELSNLIVSATFVFIATTIYSRGKNKKVAVIGLIIGSITMSIIALISNYFVIFPLYAKLLKIDLNAFVGIGAKVNPLVNNYLTLMVFSVLPFNLVKTFTTSLITMFLYKRVSRILKK